MDMPTPQNVLVVEDEEHLAHMLELELTHQGYRVGKAATGPEGLSMALAGPWDAVILDLMLPELDGLSVCRRIRERSAVPIIILTAKGEVEDRVSGLDAGADDYLPKPFHPEELLARIRAVLRRRARGDRPEEELQVGDLVLNLNTREVRRAGQLVHLTRNEFELLRFLMDNSPWVMTREMILERVWGYDYLGSSNIIDVYIRRLRSRVDDPFPAKLIHSVRGVGYVLKTL